MNAEGGILIATAFSIGVLHTLLGPDHYIPFVAIARSGRWSARKTVGITTLCGLGHVLGSVIIGVAGLLLGSMLLQLQGFESLRGESAAWLLIGFGLAYLTWGLVQAVRHRPHTHLHSHAAGSLPAHWHEHDSDVSNRRNRRARGIGRRSSFTPWALFLIFVFGPCEALIPLMMYSAANAGILATTAVVLAFAVATIGTMLLTVILIMYGLQRVRLPGMQRFGHATAGLAILVCGVLVKYGW